MISRLRLLLSGLSAVAIVAASLGVATSEAAWSDGVQASVEVRAGTWEPDPDPDPDPDSERGAVECYPADPTVVGECSPTLAWNFWGNGYRLQFGVVSSTTEPFIWEIRFDLSKAYQDEHGNPLLSQGVAMFPGLTIPYEWIPGGEWYVAAIDQSENVCAVSDMSEWPVIRLRGVAAWNQSVGGNTPIVWQTQGFQVAPSGSGYFPACS